MTKTTEDTENRSPIIISPEHTIVNGEIIYPKSIIIILESGTSFPIDQVTTILSQFEDNCKPRIKKPKFGRIKRFTRAVKIALKESLEEDNEPTKRQATP